MRSSVLFVAAVCLHPVAIHITSASHSLDDPSIHRQCRGPPDRCCTDCQHHQHTTICRPASHPGISTRGGLSKGRRETQLAERFYLLASGATHGTLPSTGITITYHLTRNTTITADRHHPENRRTCLHCANTNGA